MRKLIVAVVVLAVLILAGCAARQGGMVIQNHRQSSGPGCLTGAQHAQPVEK